MARSRLCASARAATSWRRISVGVKASPALMARSRKMKASSRLDGCISARFAARLKMAKISSTFDSGAEGPASAPTSSKMLTRDGPAQSTLAARSGTQGIVIRLFVAWVSRASKALAMDIRTNGLISEMGESASMSELSSQSCENTADAGRIVDVVQSALLEVCCCCCICCSASCCSAARCSASRCSASQCSASAKALATLCFLSLAMSVALSIVLLIFALLSDSGEGAGKDCIPHLTALLVSGIYVIGMISKC
mmetsp:Transcript_54517/g.118861  ORF Transcript_54517/g.118861 Transcript_54517/m.118861 type:complete len:254 (-) Transcript_54517:129-890(-)